MPCTCRRFAGELNMIPISNKEPHLTKEERVQIIKCGEGHRLHIWQQFKFEWHGIEKVMFK